MRSGHKAWIPWRTPREDPIGTPHHTCSVLRALLHFLQRTATLVPPACVLVLVFFRRPAASKSTSQPVSICLSCLSFFLPACYFVSLCHPTTHLAASDQPSFLPFQPHCTFTLHPLCTSPSSLPCRPHTCSCSYFTPTPLLPAIPVLRSLSAAQRRISPSHKTPQPTSHEVSKAIPTHLGPTASSVLSRPPLETDLNSIACCCVLSATIVTIDNSQSHHRRYEDRRRVSTLSSHNTSTRA